MGIKDAAKRIVYGPKASSETYIPWLRSLGMVIGDNCMVYAPTKTIIDVQHPWMIEMGNNVQITEGVTILTHGYDWSVFKGKYGDVLGSAGHVKIGSNVFIGMNVTILKGTTIGDNVVIGANSLINKDVPSDCVVVGNPQRVICSIDEYLEKRRAAQVDEAIDLYSCWRRNSPEGRRGGGSTSEGALPRVLLALRRGRAREPLVPGVRERHGALRDARQERAQVRGDKSAVRWLRGVPLPPRLARQRAIG